MGAQGNVKHRPRLAQTNLSRVSGCWYHGRMNQTQVQRLQDADDPVLMATDACTPQQRAFVDAYRISGNKVQAFRTAYPAASNYSDPAARVEAVRISNSPNVSLLLGDQVEAIRDAAREATAGAALRLLSITDIPEDASASRIAVAVQAERLLSDQAQVTGQGASVTVNVQTNNVDASALAQWERNRDAFRARHQVLPDAPAPEA